MNKLFRRAADTMIAYGLWIAAEFLTRQAIRQTPPASGRKSLLFIAEKLPPYTTVGIFRPLSWIQGAIAKGVDVTALTHPHPPTPSDAGTALLQRVPSQLKICLSPRRKLDPFIRLMPFMPVHLLSGLQMFFDGRKAVEQRPDFIIATAPNFDTFIAGLYLARLFKSKLILDYRDEWTLHPLGGWGKDKITKRWEERCLRQADLIMHTTRRQMDHHLAHFSFIPADRERVILNGCDPSELIKSATDSAEHRPGAPLKILFAGTAVPMNGPSDFLVDLEQLLKSAPDWEKMLRIRFIGDNWGDREEELCRQANQDVVQRSPAVPKSEVPGLIADADVLLIFLPPQMERYIPAKLFEYIASGKPILVHGFGGEIADIVRDLNAGPVVSTGDPDALGSALTQLMTLPPSHWQSDKRRAWAEDHVRERSAERFYAELALLAS